MSTDKAWSDFAALPKEAQKQVADLIASQRARQTARSSRGARASADILIDSGRSIPAAVAALDRHEQTAVLAISVVTQYELIVGCANKRELQKPARFLRRFEINCFDAAISDKSSELLEAYFLSHGLLTADSLIAATALTHDLPLLTKNQRDFRFIPDLRLLPIP